MRYFQAHVNKNQGFLEKDKDKDNDKEFHKSKDSR